MGIGAVMSSALSGLHVTEQGLDLVARNIANAETPGYTRKTLVREPILANGETIGVRARAVSRELDLLIQSQLRAANATLSQAEIINDTLQQIDLLLGAPGDPNALDTVFSDFSASLQQLSASPDSAIVRQEVVGQAQTLVQRLNQMSLHIQRLRTEADRGLASAVVEINAALQEIAILNREIVERSTAGTPPPDLLDERDRQIDRLSGYLDLAIVNRSDGQVSIFTESGISLFDGTAAKLEFDERGALGARTLYDVDPLNRQVGTITVNSGLNGNSIDLLQPGLVRSGAVAAYAALRDDLLVRAQDQLDEFASALAQTFSNREVAAEAVTAGAQQGFDLDLNDLLSGNSFTVTTTVSGTTTNYTFVRVDDASQLPLANDLTPNPNDTVVGIDFSGGFAAAVAAIDAALGASVTASDAGGGVLRILDDGALGLSDVTAAKATVTATSVAAGVVELPFFVDSDRVPSDYTVSLDGGPQKRGFAATIALNPLIAADSSTLVVYSTSPLTGLGDPARPLFLSQRLSQGDFDFAPQTGIGGSSTPFRGTVGEYLQRVIDYQASGVAEAKRNVATRSLTQEMLARRFHDSSSVSIDKELAQLLVLQNAYAANARLLAAADEMMKILFKM